MNCENMCRVYDTRARKNKQLKSDRQEEVPVQNLDARRSIFSCFINDIRDS